MQVNLTIKNYRCFSDSCPAEFVVRNGFTSLVGPNNAGKSSLLKFFFEFRGLFASLASNRGIFASLLQGANHSFNPSAGLLDLYELFNNHNDRDIEIAFHFGPEIVPAFPKGITVTFVVQRPTNTYRMQIAVNKQRAANMTYDLGTGFLASSQGISVNFDFAFEFIKSLSRALYIGPFRNAVNQGSSESYFDISVGQAFISQWRSSKTGVSKSSSEASLRLTEDIKRIFGFRQLEINSSDDNLTMQLFIDGKSYFLHELGSGIAQFIITLANAAAKRPTFILIDEPEMGLHPQLQLDFLTTLGSYAENGVIFSTHSMGLARAAADSVYSLQKRNDGSSELKKFEVTTNLSEFLGELSFSGYKELGFEKVLLVEGVTEVKTFQQFLRGYHMDHKVVLLPMGGSQLINGSRESELSELKRLSGKIFAVADSERKSAGESLPKDRAEFAKICSSVGIDCCVLERRATENYLSDGAVKIAKGSAWRALTEFESLKEVSPSWGKEENWRIANHMTKKDLDGTDLGKFLERLATA